MIDARMGELLAAAPDFAPRYLRLVEEGDGDPGMAAALTELADYVAELSRQVDDPLPALRRCLGAVEGLAGRGDDEAELVAWGFLDSLHPDERRRLTRWLGPRTRDLLAEVDGSEGAPDPPDGAPDPPEAGPEVAGTGAHPARTQDRAGSTAARKASGASSIG